MKPAALTHARAIEAPPPLALYVHLPWCTRKCPCCDFDSHSHDCSIPESRYVDALLQDLDSELPAVWGRRVVSVFIGVGTLSLFSPQSIDRLLSGLRSRLDVHAQTEITLEANPGAADAARFRGFVAAGVSRLSVGVQSFDDGALVALGRVHVAASARAAVDAAHAGDALLSSREVAVEERVFEGEAHSDGLLDIDGERIRCTEQGARFLDDVLARFLPDVADE